MSLSAVAQQTGKVWRIGFVTKGPRPPDGTVPAPLRKALQALGYGEGTDIVFEGRWAEVRSERLPALAAELVAAKVDLIVALGGEAAAAAKQASSVIPIVVFNAGDVVETGLVSSLARPGGNVTGVNDQSAVLSAKRLELLKELLPAAMMSYGGDMGENQKLAADYVSRVLKGARPGDLPVQQPNRYFLVINMKTAKALGLTIPQSVLLRADEVIQ